MFLKRIGTGYALWSVMNHQLLMKGLLKATDLMKVTKDKEDLYVSWVR
jgi:hypothetical protein